MTAAVVNLGYAIWGIFAGLAIFNNNNSAAIISGFFLVASVLLNEALARRRFSRFDSVERKAEQAQETAEKVASQLDGNESNESNG